MMWLHAYVTEPQATEITKHRNCESGLAISKARCMQAGPAHAPGHGDGMNRWQHSSHLLLHVLLVASISL